MTFPQIIQIYFADKLTFVSGRPKCSGIYVISSLCIYGVCRYLSIYMIILRLPILSLLRECDFSRCKRSPPSLVLYITLDLLVYHLLKSQDQLQAHNGSSQVQKRRRAGQ
jgi:hypothetical protein